MLQAYTKHVYCIDRDRIVCYAYIMLTAPITINPERKACSSWDPNPSQSSLSRTYALTSVSHLVAAQKARDIEWRSTREALVRYKMWRKASANLLQHCSLSGLICITDAL